jgi:hypothetical protein
MIAFAKDAIFSFSVLPLRAASYVGVITFIFGMLFGMRVLIHALFYDDLVQGWATVVVLESMLGGAILLCLGIIGEYVGRVYEEIKQRPLYIVRRRMNVATPFEPPRGVVPVSDAGARSPELTTR